MYTKDMKIIYIILIVIVVVVIFSLFDSESTFVYTNPTTTNTIIPKTTGTESLKDAFIDITIPTGSFSFAYLDLNSNQQFTINPDQEFYYASIFKLPVAVTVFKNLDSKKYSIQDKFTYLKEDYATGDGSLQYNEFDSDYTIEQLLTYLLKNSDNVAMNIFIREFGIDNIYQTALDLGTSKNFANNNIGKVSDGITMFKNIDTTNIISDKSRQILYSYITDTNFEDRIKPGLKNNSILVHKIGTWPDTASFHDCGIVINDNYKYYICILTKDTNLKNAQELSSKLSRITESLY
jgi:beta-lactamase class A